MKRTYQPHNTSRLRTHGFRKRLKSRGGRAVLQNRRRRGRWRLAVTAASSKK
jgi:large subunit ribosomal protein L34